MFRSSAVSSAGDPRTPRQGVPAASAVAGSAGRDARDRRRRIVPRPPGPGPARERKTGSQCALDVPDRGPCRGPRVARRRQRSIRCRSPAPGPAGPDRHRARGRAAFHRGPGRVPRLRPRPRVGTVAVHRRRRSGPAAAAPRPPRLGRRLGPTDGSRLARRPGARRRFATAGPAARRRARAFDRWPCRARHRYGGSGAGQCRDRSAAAAVPVATVTSGVRGRCRSRPRAHRARRHLPGQPDPTARDAVRLPTRGSATGASAPAIPRSSRRTSISGRAH